MTRKQKRKKRSSPAKANKTKTDYTGDWIPSAEETFEVIVNVPAARVTRQNIEHFNGQQYFPLGVSIEHDLYMIRLMFPTIPKKKVNLWHTPNGVLLPLRNLLRTNAKPALIGQSSYSRFANQIQARIPKIMAAELIEQFWSKVVRDNMYKMSKSCKRVLYSEEMFNILSSYYNTVKGNDTNRSWREVVEDRDREIERLTDDERDNNEEKEDEETIATITEDATENDHDNSGTEEENQMNTTDTSTESMNIPVLQDNLLQAENKHLRQAYESLTYVGDRPFEHFARRFEEYEAQLGEDTMDDDKRKRQFLNKILTEVDEVNAVSYQLQDDKSITYQASKIAMQNACAKYLSTELHTQPSDDDLYLIPDALLPIQTEIDKMNDSITANMQTVTRDEIDIPSDNSAATVTTTNTDIRGDIQTAADDLRKLIKQAEKQKRSYGNCTTVLMNKLPK